MRLEKFTIPENDREIFIKPAYKEIPGLISRNKEIFQTYHFNINGKPYPQFRECVRAEVLRITREYTERMWSQYMKSGIAVNGNSQYRKDSHIPETPIIQTGHAPVLMHPGVLIKHKLVDNMAKQVNGIGLNLIVDSEICRNPLFNIPHINETVSSLEKIHFTTKTQELPFEEIKYVEADQLIELRKSILQKIHDAKMNHTFNEFMKILIKLHNETQNLRDLFTFSRHAYTQRFNIDNLEVPVSLLSKTDSFSEFFLHIAQNIRTFVYIHNTTLDRYRKEKKIRSSANPLPNLEIHEDMIELPFWIWRKNMPRERLFASTGAADHMRLIYRKETVAELNFSGSGSLLNNLGKLISMKDTDTNIRPRAIVNTMYARMFVSDLFVHGVGGAKYDLLTDEIIKKFYGVTPPSYATISATLHLPYKQNSVSPKDVEDLRLIIKDMNNHPENHTTAEIMRDTSMQSMVSEKKKLIMTEIRNQNAKQRAYKRLKELTRLMKEKITPLIDKKEKELLSLKKKVHYNSIVTMRDYPFCIYPEAILRGLFSSL
ncbi:MAG: hypothetical protein GY941_00195 [Planctomycetes bacterium]|nr:hypothetical protein [Planctomycetota bacterium]